MGGGGGSAGKKGRLFSITEKPFSQERYSTNPLSELRQTSKNFLDFRVPTFFGNLSDDPFPFFPG
ncbi:hypothetical protein CH380_12390 [Leptospira adleri]|uniref:Uncharacterized protein n=1 Tax=Leptospira adleri TaxID=2023186 RepID=A0A2M9YMX3_9LEPT|nr:hypothetical protein CH380_12390 [Leptospira adleri]PJZ62491.1 hypothetical protein CH376_07555 [Leptospira adleri]